MNPVELVLAGSTLDPDTGCRLWNGALGASGYGRVTWNGKRVYAHRFAYEAYGGVLRPGMDVDHACHVAHECVAPCPHRACVAEGHLVQVTHAQNQSRTITYRSPEGRWECRRGHDLSKPDAVMRRRNGDQLCRECNCERARRWYWKQKERAK